MEKVKRISPQEVSRKLQSGATILVCAYDDDDLFGKMKLRGALSMKDLRSKLSALPKNQEIVFYCG
jgi:hypothetical protein